ncbi:MAG: DedA family protein [Candidatus Dormibacteria bacterium]
MTGEMSTEATPVPAASPEATGFKVGKGDVACVGPIFGHNLWLLFSTPIGPSLLGTHPLLLSFLRGSIPAMITAGAVAHRGDFPLILAVLAPILILCFSDPFYYWAGMRYGRPIIEYLTGPSPRAQRRMAWAERMFARWGAPMIFLAYFIPFLPQWLCLIAAGEIRMRIWVVALADGLGAICFILLCVLSGWYIGKPAIDVATTISHYGLWLTIALIAVVFVLSFRRAMAQQAQQEQPPA